MSYSIGSESLSSVSSEVEAGGGGSADADEVVDVDEVVAVDEEEGGEDGFHSMVKREFSFMESMSRAIMARDSKNFLRSHTSKRMPPLRTFFSSTPFASPDLRVSDKSAWIIGNRESTRTGPCT